MSQVCVFEQLKECERQLKSLNSSFVDDSNVFGGPNKDMFLSCRVFAALGPVVAKDLGS